MSSLKGQLANVEGSVKSMKMAVVVGSVLTVACLAAVFGVTILANEVSKETKVSNGALVNRQGATIKTATIAKSNLYTDMISGAVKVGDVVTTAAYENGTVVPGSSLQCAVQKVKETQDTVIAYCDDAAFQAFYDSEAIYVHFAEDSIFAAASPDTKTVEEIEESRRMNVPWAIICAACAILEGALSGGISGATLGGMSAGIGQWLESNATQFLKIGRAVSGIGCVWCMGNLAAEVYALF